MSVWQSEEQRCAVVLREVFWWLSAGELARAGAACRAWRAAAADPPLWRRLLRMHANVTPHTLRALTQHHAPVSWRQEYVAACAGWRLHARRRAAAALLHAHVAPGGARLALGDAAAGVAVWRCGGDWRELGRAELRARGWSAVARVHWAGSGERLLLAGPLALVDDWELIVLRVEDDGRIGTVASRVRCSAGAAGCWADMVGDAFLSLELRRLGPGLYCTTVWLNAATQETQSEYAGVTAPLLRIFNEDGAHITHALVTEAPPDEDDAPAPPEGDDQCGPGRAYLRAVDPRGAHTRAPGAPRCLVAGGGRALGAWAVRAPRPPPLLARAAGGLAERLRRRRARLAAPGADAPEPDEASVRAVCTTPDHSCRLAAPLVGLVLHERGRCLWAVCSDGSATCVSAARLRVLCRVRTPGGAPACPPAHHVQPAAAGAFLASPAGAFSPRVWCCSALSGARSSARQATHGAAAVCCALPPSCPPTLLVLAGDELYVWRSRATQQFGRHDCD